MDGEAWAALLTSVLVAGPALVLWAAFYRKRGRRLAFGALGFTAFFLTDFILFMSHVFAPERESTDVIEFAGDIVTAVLFAAAFLLPSARNHDGNS